MIRAFSGSITMAKTTEPHSRLSPFEAFDRKIKSLLSS